MTDVLLTHSYHLPYDRKQVRKQRPYPPLGTLYAASILREKGFSVAVFDTMLEDPGGFAESLEQHRPKIVAIYEDDFNFLTKMCLTRMREVAWQMATEAQTFGARVIVHGSDAADHVAEFLGNGADFVLTGAGEKTLAGVVRAIICGSDPMQIAGVVANRSGTPDLSCLPPRSLPGAIPSSMPLPARDLIDLNSYRRAWLAAHGKFSLNMVASRGCPFRCNWCAKPIFGDNFYVRPATDVADEMQILNSQYAADHIWFADDIFGLNRNWTRQLAVEVEQRDCAVPFKVQTRADLVTPEMASDLRRAGCNEVWMGVESGSQKILDAMEKGLRIDQVFSARQNLKQVGIRACYFLQFGYPSETWEDLKKTIAIVRETRPDDIGVSFSYPLPNTRFYEMVRDQLGAKRNWADSDDLCIMFQGTYTDQFYRSLRDALRAEVDSWTAGKFAMTAHEGKLRSLWSEVERSEPTSRNADPTQLVGGPARSGQGWPQISRTAENFVPIDGLLASTHEV